MADTKTGRKPFTQLTDVPPSYTTFGTNRVVVNPGETGLIFVPDTFLEEQDTPNSYVGQASKYVKVNTAETGLIFDTYPLRSQNSNAILTQNDYTILIDASLGNRTVTIPSSLTFPRIIYNIKKIDSSAFTVTVIPILGQTIDGAHNYVLTVQDQSVAIQSDNANWVVLLDDTFLKDLDTPDSYVGFGTNRVVVNPGETALIFVPDTFLEEQDTPNSYVGQAGNFVNVNAPETALQFVTPGAIAGSIAPLLIPEITNKGKQWIQHGDNVITLRKAQLDNNFRAKATIFLPLGATSVANPITYRGVFHAGSVKANSMAIVARPDTTITLKVRLEGGFGFVGLGFIAAVSGTSQRFDDIVNTQTAIITAWTARRFPSAYSLNGYGFTSGGRTAANSVGTTERFDDITTDSNTARASIVARDALSAFTINGYGFTTTGWDTVSGLNINITERFDDITNIHTPRTGEITALNSTGQFGLNNFGFVFGGSNANPIDAVAAIAHQRFDDVSNSWTSRTNLSTGRQMSTGYSLNGFGFASGGATAGGFSLGSTERFDDIINLWSARTNLTTARSELAGYSLNGFGFTSTGNSVTFAAPANSGVTERYDDIASTHSTRTAATAKRDATGYATNEYFVEYNTENVSEFDEILNLGTAWIAHGDNVITLANRHSNLDFRSDIVLQLPLGARSVANPITYRGPAHSRPMAITSRPDDPYVGFGFTSGGFGSAVTERYDDPTQVTTTRTALPVATSSLTGYSFGGFGFTSGGTTGVNTGATQRLDDAANVQTVRTSTTARRNLASFVVTNGISTSLRSFGHTIGGFIAAVTATHEEFDDIANTQTARATAGFTARDKLAGFSINQFGFGIGGTTNDVVGGITNVNERYDFITNTWSSRTVLPVNRMELAGFAFGGFGYVSGGTLNAVAMLATTDRYDNVANAWTNVGNMNTARDQLADFSILGFGFAACGNTGTDAAPVNSAVVNRYDPSTTAWTARAPAPAFTARRDLAGYANPTSDNTNGARLLVRLHGGFGFTSCGFIAAVTGITERFDDIANTQTGRTAATARESPAGYSLNGYGFTSCGKLAGLIITGITERFDDVANSQTGRAAATARVDAVGYSLNGFGITTCGFTVAQVGTTGRFDDVANTQTGRAAATARNGVTGYNLNEFGFSSGGFDGFILLGTTERFDDIGNFHVTRTSITARQFSAGYSLNGYGFANCGTIVGPAVTDIVERLDDIANVQPSRASDTVARRELAGYSLNGFGFTSGGIIGVATGATDRLDDIANIHTGVTVLNTARNLPAGYSTNEYFVNYSTMD